MSSAQILFSRVSKYLGPVILAGLLAACGGGGGGGGGSAGGGGSGDVQTAIVFGTAATGAPIVNAVVTVIDANATTKATTTDVYGNYVLNVSGLRAPLVFKVDGNVGASVASFISVHPRVETTTVNITPLTHAIAAMLASSGRPIDLFANVAVERANLTPEAINASESAIRSTLAGIMTDLDVPVTSNLINTAFAANGKGMDRLLDNISVDVQPGGKVILASVAQVAGDDTGTGIDEPSQPSAPVVFWKGNLVSSEKTLPRSTAYIDRTVLTELQEDLNACFAQASAPRTSFPACGSFISGTYLNDGKKAADEFDGMLGDANMDGAAFMLPTVQRMYTKDKLLVQLVARQTNGQIRGLITVAERTAGDEWILTGNQRPLKIFVSADARSRKALNQSVAGEKGYSSLATGLTVHVDTKFNENVEILFAKVTGPGLPDGGVDLFNTSDCAFLSTVSGACTSGFILSGKYLNSENYPVSPTDDIGEPLLSDSGIESISPFAVYKIELTKADGSPSVTYYERLRSRPPTVAELDQVPFPVISSATENLLKGPSPFAGGPSFPIDWSYPLDASPVYEASLSLSDGTTSSSKNSSVVPSTHHDLIGPFLGFAGYTTRSLQLTSINQFGTRIRSEVFWED
ncbi:hypothetical protein [Noviherbaspirillum massiliense]|uniref:hypothetical protein n=1 Tax=Noviherbaspirillum massiliense TaxID=1465823 RepID=UPI0011DE5698|nr:hypothetical protein [Noviherbaspirillum massiliense]